MPLSEAAQSLPLGKGDCDKKNCLMMCNWSLALKSCGLWGGEEFGKWKWGQRFRGTKTQSHD